MEGGWWALSSPLDEVKNQGLMFCRCIHPEKNPWQHKMAGKILRYSTVDGSRSSRLGSMTVFLAFFKENHPNHPWGRRRGVGRWRDSHEEQWGHLHRLGQTLCPSCSPLLPPTILYYNCNPDETSSRSWTSPLLQTCHMSAMILLHFHTSAIQARLQAEVGHHHCSKHVICLS